MDLADLRKKAKVAKAKGGATTAAAVAPAISQGTEVVPPVPVMVPGPVLDTFATSDVDRLNTLFELPAGLSIDTEVGYLNTLRGEAGSSEEAVRQLLTFSLGDEEYALDIETISEIIKTREITEIPRAPDFILGIISLRGIIVPIFDLKRRLRLGKGEIGAHSRIVVCQVGERNAGLLVDRISQVVRIPALSVEPPPQVLSGLDRELVSGIGRQQGRMLILLQLASVLNVELA